MSDFFEFGGAIYNRNAVTRIYRRDANTTVVSVGNKDFLHGHDSYSELKEILIGVEPMPVLVEGGKAEDRVAELEDAISWGTTCLNCASLLDSSYNDHVRAERAEAEVERLRAEIARLKTIIEEQEGVSDI